MTATHTKSRRKKAIAQDEAISFRVPSDLAKALKAEAKAEQLPLSIHLRRKLAGVVGKNQMRKGDAV